MSTTVSPDAPIRAWHFTYGDQLRDGRSVQAGDVIVHGGPLVICSSGLHASRRALDALQYAPGSTAWRVDCWGEVSEQHDKLVCTHRRHVVGAEAEEVLRAFARWCALQVIHLWDAPQVVREYLETGDELLRGAARDAARGAARGAARVAARDAAWVAARVAARDAAWVAARDAAWGTAWVAARGAARGAAFRAARDVQNAELERRMRDALGVATGGEE